MEAENKRMQMECLMAYTKLTKKKMKEGVVKLINVIPFNVTFNLDGTQLSATHNPVIYSKNARVRAPKLPDNDDIVVPIYITVKTAAGDEEIWHTHGTTWKRLYEVSKKLYVLTKMNKDPLPFSINITKDSAWVDKLVSHFKKENNTSCAVCAKPLYCSHVFNHNQWSSPCSPKLAKKEIVYPRSHHGVKGMAHLCSSECFDKHMAVLSQISQKVQLERQKQEEKKQLAQQEYDLQKYEIKMRTVYHAGGEVSAMDSRIVYVDMDGAETRARMRGHAQGEEYHMQGEDYCVQGETYCVQDEESYDAYYEPELEPEDPDYDQSAIVPQPYTFVEHDEIVM